MSEFDREINQCLSGLQAEGLYRELRSSDSSQGPRIQLAGKTLLNFSSNDYLDLANDPSLKAAAIDAIERYGAGSGASRLISSMAPHDQLDQTLAAFKGTEAALSFSSGYTAALGTICALAGKNDILILDKLIHACFVDAAKLSGATIRVFAHNDLGGLKSLLQWADAPRSAPQRNRILILTESIFSMDGDRAPLREIVELKEKYGAWLMVDEAHATGLYGANRRGLAEQSGVSEHIEIQMGTLGKALGASGGHICGSRTLIDYLVNRARPFIFSTAPVPAAAAAAAAAIRFVHSEAGEQRLNLLWQRVEFLNSKLKTADSKLKSAILPILIGDETEAFAAAARLREQGIFLPAIRYPSVPRGQARLRLTVTAAHSIADITSLDEALRFTFHVSRFTHSPSPQSPLPLDAPSCPA